MRRAFLNSLIASSGFVAILSCGGPAAAPAPGFGALTQEFVEESLALSPVSATGAGYHSHRGRRLDAELDDFSRDGLQRARRFYVAFRARLETAVDPARLSAEDRADYDIIQDQIALSLLELDDIQSYRHNPTVYVELTGNALFNPYSLEYAPKPDRYRHIIARLRRIPELMTQARSNLVDAPEVWNRVAREENDGNIDLIDHTLRAECPPELRGDFEASAVPALSALHAFNDWLRNDLSRRTSDWRLGQSLYDRKFRYALGTDTRPGELLRAAERKVAEIREEMSKLAGAEGVKPALDRIAQKHAKPEDYFNDAKRDLAEVTEFVRSRRLLDLPASGNLNVIPTPVFMRGIYGVGGFSSAPALEPKLGAYYWITPIDPDWPAARTESKLREYNFYGLKILTIHEAMPGHWVQAEFAAKVQPESRRVLRAVYGNGPYVEGWAVYATELMVNEGYLNHDRDFQLSWYKQLLRAVANSILDIRLHTQGMTEEQAMKLMLDQTYQERQEAEGKWQRAQLSSCQLPMYFLGYQGWLEAHSKFKGPAPEFHNRALAEGAVRLPSLPELISR